MISEIISGLSVAKFHLDVFWGEKADQEGGERSVLSYTVKHLCSPHTWSYARESTARPVVA